MREKLPHRIYTMIAMYPKTSPIMQPNHSTPKTNTFSMAVAGDFCPREENCADLTARAFEITAPVKPFFDSADMKVLQWECTVTKQDTPIDKSGPNHRCYPECTVFAEALAEKGYERDSSLFLPGVAQEMVKVSLETLKELKEQQ